MTNKIETTYKVFRPGTKKPEIGNVMMRKYPKIEELYEVIIPQPTACIGSARRGDWQKHLG